MVAQWARALPEVVVEPDGALRVDPEATESEPRAVFDRVAHGGLLAFLDEAASGEELAGRVKVQLVGPLTLGLALCDAGMPVEAAFRRSGAAVKAWIPAVEELVAARIPGAALLLVLDEPGLVAWRSGGGPLEHECAVDLLSAALAVPSCVTGVHVCGRGDLRIALEAGPDVLAVEVHNDLVDDAAAIGRHLDAGGWVAWGAVPTDRPVGESSEPLWRALARVWCELTRRGCDPALVRTQGLMTPACGLAGHGPTQAERALRLAVELADRVHDQAVAARLTLGA
jgi:hypothetical protein